MLSFQKKLSLSLLNIYSSKVLREKLNKFRVLPKTKNKGLKYY